MRDRSNSANAPKIEKISFPPAVVVSMPSVRDLKPTPFSARSSMSWMRVLQRPTQAVEPPHDDRVAGSELVQEPVELRTAVERPRSLVREDLDATSSLQGIEL